MELTLKEIVTTAVEYLQMQGRREFTTTEICDIALKIDPKRKKRSILGTLPGLVVGRHHPVYTEADQFLEKVKHGVYRMYEAPKKRETKKR